VTYGRFFLHRYISLWPILIWITRLQNTSRRRRAASFGLVISDFQVSSWSLPPKLKRIVSLSEISHSMFAITNIHMMAKILCCPDLHLCGMPSENQQSKRHLRLQCRH
jgi:hypothetical protein